MPVGTCIRCAKTITAATTVQGVAVDVCLPCVNLILKCYVAMRDLSAIMVDFLYAGGKP